MTGHGSRTFEVHACLGKGGFGEVYLADMVTTGGLSRQVALKVLHVGSEDASQAVERLGDEARMLATLNHPSVLAVVDVTTLDGRIALVTEYVDGEDLVDCVQAGLGARGQVQVIGQVASALDAAWSQFKIIHRDVRG